MNWSVSIARAALENNRISAIIRIICWNLVEYDTCYLNVIWFMDEFILYLCVCGASVRVS